MTGVTKLYGSVIGVNDVSVSLGRGAHGLLGPNGAGKTTFLNLITGQLRPTLGSVSVFGDNPFNQNRVLGRIGVCPGDEAFYSNVSGLDWVRYLLELRGCPPAEASDRAVESLDRVGMSEAMHRSVGQYSRGMRQRTKLAQAIAHEPELLILDEPFSGLDPVGRRIVTDLLRDWIEQGGCLILASHILHEVEAVSPAFLLICGGRLLASGTAEEIHSLLADLPNEIQVRCNDPRGLANKLLTTDMAAGFEFRGNDWLTVSTRNPLAIYNALPEWAGENGLKIEEMRSETESLQALFDNLMRVHRGGRG
jgi:ABC-2 type transport system ATP-binding protein